jgi:hypothetical protein
VLPDGSRNFFAMLWDGREHKAVIHDKVAAEPK